MTEDQGPAATSGNNGTAPQQQSQQQQQLQQSSAPLQGLEAWFLEQGGVLNKVRARSLHCIPFHSSEDTYVIDVLTTPPHPITKTT